MAPSRWVAKHASSHHHLLLRLRWLGFLLFPPGCGLQRSCAVPCACDACTTSSPAVRRGRQGKQRQRLVRQSPLSQPGAPGAVLPRGCRGRCCSAAGSCATPPARQTPATTERQQERRRMLANGTCTRGAVHEVLAPGGHSPRAPRTAPCRWAPGGACTRRPCPTHAPPATRTSPAACTRESATSGHSVADSCVRAGETRPTIAHPHCASSVGVAGRPLSGSPLASRLATICLPNASSGLIWKRPHTRGDDRTPQASVPTADAAGHENAARGCPTEETNLLINGDGARGQGAGQHGEQGVAGLGLHVHQHALAQHERGHPATRREGGRIGGERQTNTKLVHHCKHRLTRC